MNIKYTSKQDEDQISLYKFQFYKNRIVENGLDLQTTIFPSTSIPVHWCIQQNSNICLHKLTVRRSKECMHPSATLFQKEYPEVIEPSVHGSFS